MHRPGGQGQEAWTRRRGPGSLGQEDWARRSGGQGARARSPGLRGLGQGACDMGPGMEAGMYVHTDVHCTDVETYRQRMYKWTDITHNYVFNISGMLGTLCANYANLR